MRGVPRSHAGMVLQENFWAGEGQGHLSHVPRALRPTFSIFHGVPLRVSLALV